jgi:large subunit ribosomal protein L3
MRVENLDGFAIGQQLTAEQFTPAEYVDVTAVSKGKGFQGLMKLYHYKGGRATHGSSRFHRGGGSTGMRSTPGRSLPGGKRASHMGLERKTIQNLEVIKIQDNCVIIKGAVPGSRNSLVYITPAKKMTKAASAA